MSIRTHFWGSMRVRYAEIQLHYKFAFSCSHTFYFNRNRRYDLKQKELEQRRLYGNVRTILKHLNDVIKKQDQDLTLNGATLEILNLLVSISEHDSFNDLNLRGIFWIYFLPSSSSVKERSKSIHSAEYINCTILNNQVCGQSSQLLS